MGIAQLLVVTLALLVIALTMFLRAHEARGTNVMWTLRKVALAAAGTSSLYLLYVLWFNKDASLTITCFASSIAGVFFTTPGMVPWWRWVWQGFHPDEEVVPNLPAPTHRSDRQAAINRFRDENP